MSLPPAPSPRQTPSLSMLLNHAAWTPLPGRSWLRVTGPDAIRWLNGMVTNSIQALTPGMGCYNFVLSAQGKIQGDCTAFLDPDPQHAGDLLLQTTAAQRDTLQAYFERFIIMDDVELRPLTADPAGPEHAGPDPAGPERAALEDVGLEIAGPEHAGLEHVGLEIAGPEAAALLAALGLTPAATPVSLVQTAWQDHPVTLVTAYAPLTPRYEIWAAATVLAGLRDALAEHALAAHIPEAPAALFEQLRILEGTPRFGPDIRDRDLPQETAPAGTQARALHFSKGCYLGQEIVERIHSRGNLHRAFSGFTLSSSTPSGAPAGIQPGTFSGIQASPVPLPPPGTPLTLASAPDKPVGELTSIARVLIGSTETVVALGYLRREAAAAGQALLYTANGQTLDPSQGQATPTQLPFRLS